MHIWKPNRPRASSTRRTRIALVTASLAALLPVAGARAAVTTCSKAVVTINTSYNQPSGDNVAGVTTALDYPESRVTIPGAGGGSDVLARVANLSGVTGGLFSAGDTDAVLNVGLVSLSSKIPAGAFARATFDCVLGQAAPAPSDFTCVAEVSSFMGNTVAGTCSVSVTLEQPSPTPTPVPTPVPSPSPTPSPAGTPGDEIFADGFESGDLSRWSLVSTKGGKMAVSATAKRNGSYGLIFDATGLPPPASKAKLWVKDTTPAAEPRYRARFSLNLNTLAVQTDPRILRLMAGRIAGDSSRRPFELRLRFEAGVWKLYGIIRDNADKGTQTAPINLPKPGWAAVEIDWRRATGPGTNDGTLKVDVDGTTATSAGVGNDQVVIDGVQVGFLGGVGLSSTGTMFIDDFESRRQIDFP